MTIESVMTPEPVLVGPTLSLAEAAQAMRDRNVGALPVGEGDRLIGMVTDRDITIRGVAEGQDPRTGQVRSVMTEGIAYCYGDQDETEVAKIMVEKKVRRLAVLNRERRLIGFVSLGDIAKAGNNDPTVGAAYKALASVP